MTLETKLQEAHEAVRSATAIVRDQEAKVARMKAAGLNTSNDESLLSAYRAAARYVGERRDTLQALAQSKRDAKAR
jgi:hypothetical protein